MPNTLLTTDVILKEGLRVFNNETPLIQSAMRLEDKSYAGYGAREGSALRVQVPNEFSVRSGNTFAAQDVVDNSVTINRATQRGVDMTFSQKELALDIGEFSKLYVAPAMSTLAGVVEATCLQTMAESCFNAITLPVTSIDRTDIITAGVYLNQYLAPAGKGQRTLILDPVAQGQFIDGNASLFNPSANITSQYLTGNTGNAYGFDVSMSQGVYTLNRGTANGGYLVNGAGQSGASLIVDTGTGTLNKGDRFTIAGVFAVNPQTKQSLGRLQQFTVTSAYAGGGGTMSISPSIVTSGQYQNVTAGPADNAAITVYGTSGVNYPQNLAFANNSILFATAAMERPEAGAKSSVLSANGINMSLTSQYDIDSHSTKYRFDILFGFQVVVPRWIVAIPGV